MKRICKLLVSLIAAVMLGVFCLSLAACADIKKVKVNITAGGADYTLSIDLYGHLAPKTVDTIMGYIEAGDYNGALFYKMSGYDDQIMVGSIKLDENGNIVQIAKPGIVGEYEKAGTVGSDLINDKGAIGLWRSWYSNDGVGGYKASAASDTGAATWYIPTAAKTAYDKNFCVFGKYDTESTENNNAINAINNVFSSSASYDDYVIYYTGEYLTDGTGNMENNFGLTFNCVTKEAYDALTDEQKDAIFEAKNDEQKLVCFNKTDIKVAITTPAKINGITVE